MSPGMHDVGWTAHLKARKRSAIEANLRFLQFCQRTMPNCCSHFDVPHPRNSLIHSNCAREISHVECEGGKWFSKKINDIVQHLYQGETIYGQVTEIIELMGGLDLILVKHECMPSVTHILAFQVVMPVAYRRLPTWLLGVHHPSYLLCPLGLISHIQWLQDDTMDLDE
ncbi:hypothetical protein VP01_2872g2 [Puccinia sorghi]|uniref:Uncharacterized protein n=1 Tax=Puccinia sorghi TaxID=27349 RepID=A0A0L6V2K0_9BASI|nr:hypothetical protein VP01_2872g2 [Puccinia sorghi]